MLPTTDVYAILTDSESNPLRGVTVTVQLDRTDLEDGGYVVPSFHQFTTGADGRVDMKLWPNERGATQSSYTVRAWAPDGSSIMQVVAYVPESVTPLTLQSLSTVPVYPGKSDGALAVESAVTASSEAADSATAAATSETNAANSATAAAGSAGNAATSESNAAGSASAASTSASNAAGSASAAGTSETNAAASEGAAATSAGNAATSEANAAGSASAAATSESNAATSASQAASSESTATGAAAEAQEWANTPEDVLVPSGDGIDDYSALHGAAKAAGSASNAANSATAASTSETNAAQSAINAGNSETAAATSASNAATSESNAAGSASAANTSETNAAGSASAAASSASAASTSETNAAGSASAASTSASNAATSESNAAGSASAAATSESNAATSASNAATSAADAEARADEFGDLYLGAKSSNPITDNDGQALQLGALYFNTIANDMRTWDGGQWLVSYSLSTDPQLKSRSLSALRNWTVADTAIGIPGAATSRFTGAFSGVYIAGGSDDAQSDKRIWSGPSPTLLSARTVTVNDSNFKEGVGVLDQGATGNYILAFSDGSWPVDVFTNTAPSSQAWSAGGALTGNAKILDLASDGAGTCVAVGSTTSSRNTPDIHRTTDGGATWSQQTLPGTLPGAAFYRVEWCGSVFVAVGRDGLIATSPDGITWTDRSGGTTDWIGVAGVSSATLVIAGNPLSGASEIQRSTDGGATFGSAGVILPTTNRITDVAYSAVDGVFTAIFEEGSIAFSVDDGLTWTLARPFPVNYKLTRFVKDDPGAVFGERSIDANVGRPLIIEGQYGDWTATGVSADLDVVAKGLDGSGNLLYLASGTDGAFTSTDGRIWSRTEASGPGSPDYLIHDAVGIWVALYAGSLQTSADGLTWTARTVPNLSLAQGLAYGGGTWVIAGRNTSMEGRFWTSPDGITWTERSFVAATSVFDGVAYTAGRFIVYAGHMTNTWVSDDNGASWTTVNGPPLRTIIAGDVLLGFRFNNVYESSDNGDSWTIIGDGASFYHGYLAAVWISSNSDGLTEVSIDGGKTWASQSGRLPTRFDSSGGSRFFSVGDRLYIPKPLAYSDLSI